MSRNFQSKAQKQAAWMQAFEGAVLSLDAKHAGRIEWESARHFFFTGLTPSEAAETYVKNRKGEA